MAKKNTGLYLRTTKTRKKKLSILVSKLGYDSATELIEDAIDKLYNGRRFVKTAKPFEEVHENDYPSLP